MFVFQNYFYQIKNTYLKPEIFYFNFCQDFMLSHVIKRGSLFLLFLSLLINILTSKTYFYHESKF